MLPRLELFPSLGEKMGNMFPVRPFEKANANHWTTRIIQYITPNSLGTPLVFS
jgi:hypothetical protein